MKNDFWVQHENQEQDTMMGTVHIYYRRYCVVSEKKEKESNRANTF